MTRCTRYVAEKLETVGLNHYHIDYELGVAVVFFEPDRETLNERRERRRQKLLDKFHWAGFELRRR